MTGPTVFEWDEPLPGMPDEPEGDVAAFEEAPRSLPALAHATEEVASDAVISLTTPDRVLQFATETRRHVVASVRQLYETCRRRRRPGRLTEAHVASELVFLAGAADALDALADAIRAGAQEARSIAGDVIADVKLAEQGDTRIGTVSLKVGAPDGSVISAKRTQPSKLDVNAGVIVDVLAAQAASAALDDAWTSRKTHAYVAGVREGWRQAHQLSSLSWRTSALDHLATQLEQADEHDLAIRLRQAYGRKPHGDPKIELKRELSRGKD